MRPSLVVLTGGAEIDCQMHNALSAILDGEAQVEVVSVGEFVAHHLFSARFRTRSLGEADVVERERASQLYDSLGEVARERLQRRIATLARALPLEACRSGKARTALSASGSSALCASASAASASPSYLTGVPALGHVYPMHAPDEVVQAGLKSGEYLAGVLHVSRRNPREAFVRLGEHTALGNSTEVFLDGTLFRNRAVDGDRVAVCVLPRAEWSAPTASLVVVDEVRCGVCVLRCGVCVCVCVCVYALRWGTLCSCAPPPPPVFSVFSVLVSPICVCLSILFFRVCFMFLCV
jgi:Rrp44-like cold shock domain